jgi:hypothetical protein
MSVRLKVFLAALTAAILVVDVSVAPPSLSATVLAHAGGGVSTTKAGFSTTAVGWSMDVTTDNVPLFQCPATWCNKGWVSRGLDTRMLCRLGDYYTGNNWALVLNKTWAHVGWMDTAYLYRWPPAVPLCFGTGYGVQVEPRGSAQSVYQCPGTHCNSGTVYPSDDIAYMCGFFGVYDPGDLVLDQNNKNVGFMHPYAHSSPYTFITC